MPSVAHVDQMHAEIVEAIWDHFQGSISTQQAHWCAAAVLASPTLVHIVALIEADHVLDLGPDGWTVEHPIACRLDGRSLNECEVLNTVAPEAERLLDEWGQGRFKVWPDDSVWCGFDGSPEVAS